MRRDALQHVTRTRPACAGAIIIIIAAIAALTLVAREFHAAAPPARGSGDDGNSARGGGDDGALAGGDSCDADVNGSGAVDVDDLIAVILQWGGCPQPCPPACQADTDASCAVDVDDLIAVILGWGPCPCHPGGVWVNASPISYSCAFGLVNFNITQWNFSQPGATLGVIGAPVNMTGPAVSCAPGTAFSVSGTLSGSCAETYTLAGTFTSPNQFSGTFTAAYAGSCFNCTTQVFNVNATRSP